MLISNYITISNYISNYIRLLSVLEMKEITWLLL